MVGKYFSPEQAVRLEACIELIVKRIFFDPRKKKVLKEASKTYLLQSY